MESTISAAPQIFIDREKMLRGHRHYWVLRRAQDIVFSLLALILLAPLALVISLAIVLDSPGDGAIFRQRRVGRDGKLFWLYKFRTMCPDAEKRLNELLKLNQMDGPVFKIKGDPRITRVGRFLRKTSLDELPQLLNVLRGDMSIVGPRPALPREVELYSDYQRQRLYVTPGLSCYWQITPHRNEMSFDEWVALDLKYIQERSFWVDWKIIFLTVRAMFMKYGE
jgi:lipopolysaccharide/colanic/teichoic acid biosynthesis glycosyltransferase